MEYNAILTSEDKEYSIIVSPKWLLDNSEEDLVEKIVCSNQCGINYAQGEDCYGECLDVIYEFGYQIKFEVV